MQDLNIIDWIALILVIIGALNWGLVGLFKKDAVKTIFGENSALTRTIFSIVGLAGLYLIYLVTQLVRKV